MESLETLCIQSVSRSLTGLPDLVLEDVIHCTRRAIAVENLTRYLGVAEGYLYDYLQDMIDSGRTGRPRECNPDGNPAPEAQLAENIAGCVYSMFIGAMEEYRLPRRHSRVSSTSDQDSQSDSE